MQKGKGNGRPSLEVGADMVALSLHQPETKESYRASASPIPSQTQNPHTTRNSSFCII